MATVRRLRGRWQAQVRRRGVPPRGKSLDKRTDATRWARELEAEADRSGWVADTRLAEKTTLGELLTRYRDQVSPTKRSAHTERSRINAMLRRPIVHRTLSKLTSADVATYRDERLKDVAPATVVRELNTLSHAIEMALREWGLWLPRNPVKMVRRPSVPQGRKRRLEDGEEERLLAALPLHQRQVQADIRTHLIHRPARDIFPRLAGCRVFAYCNLSCMALIPPRPPGSNGTQCHQPICGA